jgi:LacI family transcriptional regulator
MTAPRVLVVLGTSAGWSREILAGFMAAAHVRGWVLLHYHPNADLDWLAREWQPDVIVVGPELPDEALGKLARVPLVSVNADRSAERIASVCLDEDAIAALALKHLLSTGLRDVTLFRFDDSAFAVARERTFIEATHAAHARFSAGWWLDHAVPPRSLEQPELMVQWLRGLPKPCGIFTCTDPWGRVVARYARAAELRVPEDLALVGVDNDSLECELIAPPLSSVMIPWEEVGRSAAELVRGALGKRPIAGKRVVVAPIAVLGRRSSDVLAISDPLVADAVRWIRSHADQRLTVPVVAKAVGGGRQRLERRFRSALDRTVQEEIRRAHVEAARVLLASTSARLPEIAKQSGFTNASLLSAAFQRELSMSPGAYRRRVLK